MSEVDATFFFTDIEGSTAVWEQYPQQMQGALEIHDRLLTESVTSCGGTVFKHTGDGVCAVFASAPDAVRAAVAVQQAFDDEPWDPLPPLRIRVALHSGPAAHRDGDYFGPTLNRVARLLGVAYGGQITLTQATEALARSDLPEGTSLLDLGTHRLRDLTRPLQVFQLGHADLKVEFPPLRSLDAHPNNLPHRITEFIGRRQELEEVQSLLGEHRLVTAAGPGGIGKTSLALQAAARILDDYPDGVWLIELAPLTDHIQIPGTVAGVLGVENTVGIDLTEAVGRHLGDKRVLLVLDNCEHVVDGAAKFANALLHAAEQVSVLATSREPLRIGGEAIYRVPSLGLPPPDSGLDLPAVEAIELFADRASLIRPDLQLEDELPVVGEICQHLDGIPLAIELAAARLASLNVSQIADRLDERFDLLTKGDRSAMRRHQTLRALVDWSHDLLTEPEQVLYRRLGAFGGSLTLAAVEQVGGSDPLAPTEVADLLDRLVETSLVLAPEPPSPRFRMLETIRQHAAENLEAAGETDGTMRRLGAYLLEAGPPTEEGVPEGDWEDWLAWRAEEQDNFRASLSWSRVAPDPEICGLLAVEFFNYLGLQAFDEEANGWIEAALQMQPDRPGPLRLSLLKKLAVSAANRWDPEALGLVIARIRPEAEALGDDVTTAWTLALEAEIEVDKDPRLALTLYEEGAAGLMAAEDRRYEHTVAGGLEIYGALGMYDEAEAMISHFEEARTKLGWPTDRAFRTTSYRAAIAYMRGEYDRAVELSASCLEPSRDFGPLEHGGHMIMHGRAQLARGNLTEAQEMFDCGVELMTESITATIPWLHAFRGLLAVEQGRLPAAAHHLSAALDSLRLPGRVLNRMEVLVAVSRFAIAAGRPMDAAVLVGATDTTRDSIPGFVPEHFVAEHRRMAQEDLELGLPAPELETAIADGRSMEYEAVKRLAREVLDV